ncbi:hypothetical protein EUGRSUZ_H00908 [Eucalyptus grandis]|uniref:Uncharacterized protein n=2 Tax=Eucalyptus grandis TaxID=71139 RepID=A0A059AWE7_EUCGR|nr:hypothetical protein EUGRSUZ_H00908 [Eucalyptus grandis]
MRRKLQVDKILTFGEKFTIVILFQSFLSYNCTIFHITFLIFNFMQSAFAERRFKVRQNHAPCLRISRHQLREPTIEGSNFQSL